MFPYISYLKVLLGNNLKISNKKTAWLLNIRLMVVFWFYSHGMYKENWHTNFLIPQNLLGFVLDWLKINCSSSHPDLRKNFPGVFQINLTVWRISDIPGIQDSFFFMISKEKQVAISPSCVFLNSFDHRSPSYPHC